MTITFRKVVPTSPAEDLQLRSEAVAIISDAVAQTPGYLVRREAWCSGEEAAKVFMPDTYGSIQSAQGRRQQEANAGMPEFILIPNPGNTPSALRDRMRVAQPGKRFGQVQVSDIFTVADSCRLNNQMETTKKVLCDDIRNGRQTCSPITQRTCDGDETINMASRKYTSTYSVAIPCDEPKFSMACFPHSTNQMRDCSFQPLASMATQQEDIAMRINVKNRDGIQTLVIEKPNPRGNAAVVAEIPLQNRFLVLFDFNEDGVDDMLTFDENWQVSTAEFYLSVITP